MKIFGIGFHKTGTTSLKGALETLGFKVTGPNGVRRTASSETALSICHDLVPRFDAFQDNPWPLVYQQMNQSYPGSKFILTYRQPEAWIHSVVKHFGTRQTEMRRWIYGVGCPAGNETIYLQRYREHNAEVVDYFADFPGQLLVLDVTKGDGWKSLCDFLGLATPDCEFPHLNQAAARQPLWRRLIRNRISGRDRVAPNNGHTGIPA